MIILKQKMIANIDYFIIIKILIIKYNFLIAMIKNDYYSKFSKNVIILSKQIYHVIFNKDIYYSAYYIGKW